jgi:hypothetical protein
LKASEPLGDARPQLRTAPAACAGLAARCPAPPPSKIANDGWSPLRTSTCDLCGISSRSPSTAPPTRRAGDAARIAAAAWAEDVEWGLLVWLLLVTGARRGEYPPVVIRGTSPAEQARRCREALPVARLARRG